VFNEVPRVELQLHNLALDESEWSDSRSGRFALGIKAPAVIEYEIDIHAAKMNRKQKNKLPELETL
jgi:hypothetical protein